MKVCFIGHRKIEQTDSLRETVKNIVIELIAGGADSFLFGSRSEFDRLCYEVVTELQIQNPNLKRISYNAPHETSFTSKKEREEFERFAATVLKIEVYTTDYEQAIHAIESNGANKNAYIMRNQEMIHASDICVFYYSKNYLPPKRKHSQRDLFEYQPKSGTAIAYSYAQQQKKKVINVFEIMPK